MTRNELLLDWVALQHEGQLIRATQEPYLNHLLRVAKMAAPYTEYGNEIGLCHDLLEKTSVTWHVLHLQLLAFGYGGSSAPITSAVSELTRGKKENEEARLLTISAAAQTVKYADYADNMDWMMAHEPEKAKSYLQRKMALIARLVHGHPQLRQMILNKASDLLTVLS